MDLLTESGGSTLNEQLPTETQIFYRPHTHNSHRGTRANWSQLPATSTESLGCRYISHVTVGGGVTVVDQSEVWGTRAETWSSGLITPHECQVGIWAESSTRCGQSTPSRHKGRTKVLFPRHMRPPQAVTIMKALCSVLTPDDDICGEFLICLLHSPAK